MPEVRFRNFELIIFALEVSIRIARPYYEAACLLFALEISESLRTIELLSKTEISRLSNFEALRAFILTSICPWKLM
jgi:hypothetical protein